MDFSSIKPRNSHGDGQFRPDMFRLFGQGVIIESGVLVFHPENISVHDHVYVGHQTILKGYYQGEMIIGEGSWIGQQCFIHSAGDVIIGKAVGIGPGVKILTSVHDDFLVDIPVIHHPVRFAPVNIGDGADIGTGAILLPGITIGEGAIVGAGSVVNIDVEPFSVYAGVPARFLRYRNIP
ncbi:MAG: acyltransferase [Paludibacter sp.]|nr:acyltransferase [Paludibacter sp.]